MPAITFDDLLSDGFSDLAGRVEWQESRGNQRAVSPAGAFGVMQLMPGTARDPGFGVAPLDRTAPDAEAENRRVGQDYLSAMLKRYNGDQEAALAAYNWGPGNADKWVAGGKDPSKLPRETRDYITNILGGQQATQPQNAQVASRALTFDDLIETEAAPTGMPWSEVGQSALKNAPQDAYNVALGLSKLGTPQGLAEVLPGVAKTVAGGVEQLLGLPAIGDEQEYSQRFGDYLSGYGSVEGIKEKIATQPISTALDVATLATPLKAGAITKAGRTVAPKIATSAELKAAGGAGLDVARDSGVYFTKDFVEPFGQTLNTTAYNMGFRPGRAGTQGLSRVIKDVEGMQSKPWSFRQIHELDQDLNDIIVKSPRGPDGSLTTEAAIASKMKGIIDDFMGKIEEGNGAGLVATGDLTAQQAANIYKNSLAAYHHGKKADRVARLLEKADVDSWLYTQSGIAPQIKKHFRQLYKSGKRTGYTDAEWAMVKDIATGSLADRALMLGSKLAIRGPVSAGMNAVFGSAFGGPMANVLMAGVGEGSRKLLARRTQGKVERLKTHILEKGSENLRNLLGETVTDHMLSTPKGRNAITSWIKNHGAKATSRSLALIIAQEVKRPDLAPRIQAELEALAEAE